MNVPEEWSQVQLSSLIHIKHGWAFQGAFFAQEGRYALLTPANFHESGGFRHVGAKQKFYMSDFPEEYLLTEGDLVLVMTEQASGLLGASAIVPESGRWLHNQRIGLVQRITQGVETNYLHWVYNSFQIRKRISETAAGTKVRHTSPDKLVDLEILLPPLPEQKAIADTLSTWDTAIETMVQMIAAKERRLNGLGRRITAEARNFSSPKWRKVRLYDVLKEHGDLSTGKEPVYSVSVHKGLVDQIEHLGRSFSAASTDHYNRVHFGDLVYTKSPTGDFPLGIIKQSQSEHDVIVSPLYGVYTPATFELGVILDFLFSSPVATRNYLAPLVQKGAKNTISITNQGFLQGELWLPMDHTEQQSLCDLIRLARTEFDGMKQELELLQRQKRGLMQKLLTGRWRVEVSGSAFSQMRECS